MEPQKEIDRPRAPRTKEEAIARAEEGRRQIAMGNYITSEELFRQLNDEFHFLDDEIIEDQLLLEEAV